MIESVSLHLSGVLTALATPFRDDGALQLDAWESLIEWQIESGVQGLVVAGSTGEAAMLQDDEYALLIETAVRVVAGRVPVLAGSGLSGTAKTIAQTRQAAAAGADAALVVTPAYVRPTQAGLIAHYRAVVAEGGLPVMLYNVPGRTGCDMLPETVAALLDVDGVLGLKEARNDPERMLALLPLRRKGFCIFSGDDATAMRAMAQGADGVISVASNAMPGCFRRLYNLVRAGNLAEAQVWNARLDPYYEFCSIEPNPIPVKALMQRVGYGSQQTRLPLLPLSVPYRLQADQLASEIRDLEAQCRAENVAVD